MMNKMTEDSLSGAFAGESQAHMKYLVFAQKAQEEGLQNIARLFRAVAFAEQVHASNHFRALKGVGETAANLAAAVEGENFEVEQMYPAYMAVADLQGEKEARRSMRFAWEAEKIHARMYQAAKEAAARGQDAKMGELYICGICGHTVEGSAPDKCPTCGAQKSNFVKF